MTKVTFEWNGFGKAKLIIDACEHSIVDSTHLTTKLSSGWHDIELILNRCRFKKRVFIDKSREEAVNDLVAKFVFTQGYIDIVHIKEKAVKFKLNYNLLPEAKLVRSVTSDNIKTDLVVNPEDLSYIVNTEEVVAVEVYDKNNRMIDRVDVSMQVFQGDIVVFSRIDTTLDFQSNDANDTINIIDSNPNTLKTYAQNMSAKTVDGLSVDMNTYLEMSTNGVISFKKGLNFLDIYKTVTNVKIVTEWAPRGQTTTIIDKVIYNEVIV